jgi:hypothetical protein
MMNILTLFDIKGEPHILLASLFNTAKMIHYRCCKDENLDDVVCGWLYIVYLYFFPCYICLLYFVSFLACNVMYYY